MIYSFYFEGGLNNNYYFETDFGIIYVVKFKPSPYVFEIAESDVSKNIFEFSLIIEYNPQNILPATDKKIGATAVAIFIDFYKKKGKAITIYICESSDGKQLIRKRKFDQWFLEYSDENFVKIDEVLLDKNNNKFPIAIILNKSNPYRMQIIEAFLKIADSNIK